jgi:hypothetical protein
LVAVIVEEVIKGICIWLKKYVVNEGEENVMQVRENVFVKDVEIICIQMFVKGG